MMIGENCYYKVHNVTMKALWIVIFFVAGFGIKSLAQMNYWQPVNEMNYVVTSLYNDSIDDVLYAGGWFGRVDGKSIYGIAKWNGSEWDSLGKGLDYHFDLEYAGCNVWAICRYQDKLYVGGNFQTAGDLFANCIATWDGLKWDTLPFKFNGSVQDIIVHDEKLFVCGTFDSVGSIEANGVVMFDGITWTSLGLAYDGTDPNEGNVVVGMAFYKDILYLTGYFYDVNGYQHNMMRWDGISWSYMSPDIMGGFAFTWAMNVYNDMLVVSGSFSTQQGNADNNIQAWDGTTWHAMGGGTGTIPGWANGSINNLFVYEDKLYAVGPFKSAGGIPADHIAIWDGNNWCGLGSQFNNNIKAAAFYHDTLYIGGAFTTISADTIKYIAKWSGGNFVDTCSMPVGIPEITQSNFSFSVYPNPANDQLYLSIFSAYPEKKLVTITDLMGTNMLKESLDNGDSAIDISSLPIGVYFLELKTYEGRSVRKFVKQ